MALLRFIAASPARTTLTLVSGASVTGYALLAGADFGDAAWQHEFSGPRGTQGARPAPGVPQNRTVTLPIRIAGTSKDDLAVKRGDLEQVVDELRRFGGQICWQSNNQTYRQWFRVMTAGFAGAEWGNRAEVINRAVVTVAAVCAPYVEGEPMDLADDFSTSVIGDYTFDTGGGSAAIAGGQMTFSSSAEKRFWHNLTGYQVSDAEGTIHYRVGSTSAVPGVILRRTGPSDFLVAQIDTAAAQLRIKKVVAGVETSLTNTPITALAAGTDYWLVFRAEANLLTAEHWTSVPRPGTAATTTLIHQLASTDQAAFGRGVKGLVAVRFTPAGTLSANYVDDLRVEPYTYRGQTIPREFPLLGLPGSADALADIWLHMPFNASAVPVFALFGWARLPAEPWNLVWNGGFELGAAGWATTGITNAATSVTAAGQVLYGAAGGRVVTPGAAITEGANFHLYRRFERGRAYTISAWARSNTGASQSVQALLGSSGADFGASGTVTLPSSGAWTQLSATWYPTADRQEAYAAIATSGTHAYTFDLDGVQVYEGTSAPTIQTQSGGRGGLPPLGVISAAAAWTAGSGVITADATAFSGYRIGASPGVGAFSWDVYWRFDPSLVTQDDYQEDSGEIEFFARMKLSGDHSNVTVATSVASYIDTLPLGASVGTREWGLGTKPLTLPGAGVNEWRLVRLGTLPLPAGATRRADWVLHITVAGTAGVGAKIIAIDHLIAVPARARCLTPTGLGKATGYPQFFTLATTSRVVHSDRSGSYAYWPVTGAGYDLAPAPGLGGSPVELPAGDVLFVPRISGNIPDESSSGEAVADYTGIALHLAVRPRWGLLRDA